MLAVRRAPASPGAAGGTCCKWQPYRSVWSGDRYATLHRDGTDMVLGQGCRGAHARPGAALEMGADGDRPLDRATVLCHRKLTSWGCGCWQPMRRRRTPDDFDENVIPGLLALTGLQAMMIHHERRGIGGDATVPALR